jgi:uncharacterized membrane protein
MLAWDVTMEPTWATLDRAWVWQSGGPYFGVPISNFFGWFLTVYLIYQLFAIYLKEAPLPTSTPSKRFWRAAILFYGLCAAGNLLLALPPGASLIVTDPSGTQWAAADIIHLCVLTSILVMAPFPLLAWSSS